MFPSGKPTEHIVVLEQPDPTWKAEYEYFKRLCQTGGTNIENDFWVSEVLGRIRPDAPVQSTAEHRESALKEESIQ